MSRPRVTAVIVNYYSGHLLRRCVESVRTQLDIDVEVILVNNSAEDPLPDSLTENGVQLLSPPTNVGFCAAVNMAISASSGDYVLLLNPDGWIDPGYISGLVAHLEADPTLGSAAGRILKVDAEGRTTGRVDSLGLEFLAGRRPADIGHGGRDSGDGSVHDAFGVSAAAGLYRREALERVAVAGQVLPEDFFMYLDDVDLAWRLRLGGYRSVVDASRVAYHARASAGKQSDKRGPLGWIGTAAEEIQRPDYVRTLISTNLFLMLLRCDEPASFICGLPTFALRRLPVEGLLAMQRPIAALSARARLIRLLPRAVQQRRLIQSHRRVGPGAIEGWFR